MEKSKIVPSLILIILVGLFIREKAISAKKIKKIKILNYLIFIIAISEAVFIILGLN